MTRRKEDATAILKLQGLNDSGRAQQLRRDADKLDGVLGLDLNYILDTLTIKYDADKLTLAQVREKLAKPARKARKGPPAMLHPNGRSGSRGPRNGPRTSGVGALR